MRFRFNRTSTPGHWYVYMYVEDIYESKPQNWKQHYKYRYRYRYTYVELRRFIKEKLHEPKG